MSRPSAATDARLWPAAVCAWVVRERRRRRKQHPVVPHETEPDNPYRRHRPTRTGLTQARYFTRFLFDLDAAIAQAKAGSTRHAWQIAGMYREAHRRGRDRDPDVLKFLDRIHAFMESARKRYTKDSRRSIGKALRVHTAKRGRRTRAASVRSVTDDMITEALMIYDAELRAGRSEKYAVSIAVKKTGIRERAIRSAVAARRGPNSRISCKS